MRRLSKTADADAFWGDGVLLPEGDDVVAKAHLRVTSRPHPDASVRSVVGDLRAAYSKCADDVRSFFKHVSGHEPLGKASVFVGSSSDDLMKSASAGKQEHSGLMVSLDVPFSVAEVLACPGGVLPDDMHVTLCYFSGDSLDAGKAEFVLEAVASLARRGSPLAGSFAGRGRFAASETSDGLDVFFATVDVPGLVELRQEVLARTEVSGLRASRKHGFTPHVTLAYLTQDDDGPSQRSKKLPVSFDRISVTFGGEHHSFELGTGIVKSDSFGEAADAALSPLDPALAPLVVIGALAGHKFLDRGGKRQIVPSEALFADSPGSPPGEFVAKPSSPSAPEAALRYVASCLRDSWDPSSSTYATAAVASPGEVGEEALRFVQPTGSFEGATSVARRRLDSTVAVVAARLNGANAGLDRAAAEAFRLGRTGKFSSSDMEAVRRRFARAA